MGVKEELAAKYGSSVDIVTKKKGPYNVHVALSEEPDGTTVVRGIKAEQTRPAIFDSDKFFNSRDIPMLFGDQDSEEVKRVIDKRL